MYRLRAEVSDKEKKLILHKKSRKEGQNIKIY